MKSENNTPLYIFINTQLYIFIIVLIIIIITTVLFFSISLIDNGLIIKKYTPNYNYNNVICKSAISSSCGYHLMDCSDKKEYVCTTNVQLIWELEE